LTLTATNLPDPGLLLAPLLLDGPCGADLRYDQVYDKIVELGRSETEGLPMGVWERESKKSDWHGVVALCVDVLGTRTKDMQIAAWLGQALTRLHGPRGAALGWKMFSSLTTTFWQDIHPRMNDNDTEIRMCAVYWLTQHTSQWLTEYLAASASERDNLQLTEPANAEDTAALTSLLQELLQLQLFLDQQLGQQASLFHQLTEPLHQRLALLAVLAPPALAHSTAFASTDISAMKSTPTQHTFNSRDAAYAALGDIARVLAKSEPHSPVPMILEALVSWRDCQFNDLLTRMPQDKANLYELLKFFKQP
jgi:type VI secretion system protein ImpA